MTDTDILLLKPVFKERIWGGNAIHSVFDLPVPEGKVGEAWIISAHANGPSEILNGEFQGETLDSLYKNHRGLFGNDSSPVFPLLTKILDAQDRLSVQIHPDDVFAARMEHELGKSECWYVLDAKPKSYLVVGHTAKTRTELLARVKDDQWDALLKRVPVKKGDFVYIPAGTIHAIGAGILILETQQSSDVTYRLHDYGRVDPATGKPRELHLEKGLATTIVPAPTLCLANFKDAKGIVKMVETKHFTVEKWNIAGTLGIPNPKHRYYLCTLIEGRCLVNGHALKAGESFIVPSTTVALHLDGIAQMIVSYREK